MRLIVLYSRIVIILTYSLKEDIFVMAWTSTSPIPTVIKGKPATFKSPALARVSSNVPFEVLPEPRKYTVYIC